MGKAVAKENNVKISVENYGPIAKAKDIELCPLTVFVGPSNTGKSYLAILIYALFNSFESGWFYLRSPYRMKRRPIGHLQFNADMDDEIDGLLEDILNKKAVLNTFSRWPKKLQKWVNEKVAVAIDEKFHGQLSRCMGTQPKENSPIQNNFNLQVESNRKSLTLRSSGRSPSMKIKELVFAGNEFTGLGKYVSDQQRVPKEAKAGVFIDQISEKIFHPQSGTESFYLPAARTGIMQSHRAIAGALVRRAPFAGIEDLAIPTLSGIVSDFLEEVIYMDTEDKPSQTVWEIASEMEKNILHGSIESGISENKYPPQFFYKQNGLRVPLLRSSSMVSELAPVVLFLRHRVGKGDLLIIEEPESHLHPEAQRGIAQTVVQLVRKGVRVMVTTHSDYFLEQIGNYVRISKLMESKDKEPKDFLKEEEVGGYAFNSRRAGTVVERLHFDTENGLSPEDHDKVSSDLYNETVEILEQIDNMQRNQ